MADSPAWADLQPDLRRRIFRNPGLEPAHTQVDGWLRWCRLVVTGGAACKALRSALLGPDARPVWRHVVFSADLPHALTRLTVSQAHHARSATIVGGDWESVDLQAVAGSLTGLTGLLRLCDITVQEEADILGGTLSGHRVQHMQYWGSKELALPPTLTKLRMNLGTTLPSPAGADFLAAQEVAPRLFGCLAPLAALQELTLVAPMWKFSAADIAQLRQRHPLLQRLDLTLVTSHAQPLALAALASLHPHVQISLALSTGDSILTTALHQLRDVPLQEMTLTALEFSHKDEEALAELSISRTLTVQLTDAARRLTKLPHGCQVVYEHFDLEAMMQADD